MESYNNFVRQVSTMSEKLLIVEEKIKDVKSAVNKLDPLVRELKNLLKTLPVVLNRMLEELSEEDQPGKAEDYATQSKQAVASQQSADNSKLKIGFHFEDPDGQAVIDFPNENSGKNTDKETTTSLAELRASEYYPVVLKALRKVFRETWSQYRVPVLDPKTNEVAGYLVPISKILGIKSLKYFHKYFMALVANGVSFVKVQIQGKKAYYMFDRNAFVKELEEHKLLKEGGEI